MQEGAAQRDATAQCSVLRCAAGKVASTLQKSFLLLYRIFSSYAREQSGHFNGNEVKNSVADAGQGWAVADLQGRAGKGAGPGRWLGRFWVVGGRECSYINRIECRFRAVFRGKNR